MTPQGNHVARRCLHPRRVSGDHPNMHLPRHPLRKLARILALLAVIASPVACTRTIHGVGTHDVDFASVHYRVVTLDLARADLGLHWRDPANGKPFATIEALRQWGVAQHQELLFAANAGIYDAANEPLGMYVEDGKQIKPLNTAHGNPASGNFSLLPNGVFWVDADHHAHVATTADFAAAHVAPRLATQSGPMLVINGAVNPHFDVDSDSAKWRSGVCAPKPGEALFVVSTAPVNFHAFATFFRDKLHCRDALFLDGTLSQIYVNGNYYGAPAFMVKPYAGMFAVFAPDSRR